MKRLGKKGFTLIELLAVIIILGILMIIAIPSVTEYINNSRKDAYVKTASAYITAVRTKVNEMTSLKLTSTGVAYFVEVADGDDKSCVELEKGGKSPYGEWEKAYVVVVFDGTSYDYYFTAVDDSNMGLVVTMEKDFDKELVKSASVSKTTIVVDALAKLNTGKVSGDPGFLTQVTIPAASCTHAG